MKLDVAASVLRTAVLALLLMTLGAIAAPFTAGNLVIFRVGDGSGALTSAATPVFLDEYTTAGAFVQSVPMPTSVSGPNRRLTASGTATSEGLLAGSVDGAFLVLTGYDAAVGTATVAGTPAATTNRVIGTVNASATADTTTALTDAADGGNPRSATSTDGTNLWIAGSAGGIRYTTLGTTTTSTQLSTTVTNLRQTKIFGGQLHVSDASGATVRLGTVGTGTPTTSGQTITNLPGFPTTGSPYSFFFGDLDAGVAGLDTLYVADDAASGGQIQKYSLVAGSWTANGTIAAAVVRGLTGKVNGTTVTLYVTSPTALSTLADTSGYNATITGALTPLAAPGTNTVFRGVSFTPPTAPVELTRFVAE